MTNKSKNVLLKVPIEIHTNLKIQSALENKKLKDVILEKLSMTDGLKNKLEEHIY